jgi:hypothetical protein
VISDFLNLNLEKISMNANVTTLNRSDAAREAFAAELTDAAFPVALEHGLGDNWLEVKLNLWKALDRAVETWRPTLCEELSVA